MFYCSTYHFAHMKLTWWQNPPPHNHQQDQVRTGRGQRPQEIPGLSYQCFNGSQLFVGHKVQMWSRWFDHLAHWCTMSETQIKWAHPPWKCALRVTMHVQCKKHKYPNCTVNLDQIPLAASSTVRSWSKITPRFLSFNSHIKQVTMSAFFHLRNIGKIWKILI